MTENTIKEYSVVSEKIPVSILIVDDDKDVLDALKDLLTMNEEYQVETATNVFSAKKKLNHLNPDIALLDIRLGTGSGLDLASLINRESPDTDCIMMTAHRDVDYAVKALRYGATDYLFKPVDPEQLLHTMENIFHQRRIKHEEASKKRNLRTILNQTSGFVFLLSPSGNCLEASHAALSYIDQEWDQIIGKPFWENPLWRHADVASNQLKMAVEVASSGGSSRLDIEVSDSKGRRSWFDFSLKPVFENDDQVSLIIAEGHDLTEHKNIEQNLKRMALHDPLTDLANRTLLYEHLDTMLARASRNNQQFSVMFIDLDNFKEINDSLGHQAGDDLLVNVARCIKTCMRENDIVARIGGDEFVIVLGPESDRENTIKAVNRLTISLLGLSKIEGYSKVVSASIGIASYPNDGKDAEALLRNADTAMYMAKKKGKNCFHYFKEKNKGE